MSCVWKTDETQLPTLLMTAGIVPLKEWSRRELKSMAARISRGETGHSSKCKGPASAKRDQWLSLIKEMGLKERVGQYATCGDIAVAKREHYDKTKTPTRGDLNNFAKHYKQSYD